MAKNKQNFWTNPFFAAFAVIAVLFVINSVARGGLTGAQTIQGQTEIRTIYSPTMVLNENKDAGEGGEIHLQASGGGDGFHLDEHKGTFRVHKDGKVWLTSAPCTGSWKPITNPSNAVVGYYWRCN